MFMSQTQVSYQAPTSAIYERKFDTALRASFDRDMRDRIAEDKTSLDDNLLLKSKYLKIPFKDLQTTPDFYADILLEILNSTPNSNLNSPTSKKIRRAYSIIEDVVKIQHTYIQTGNFSNMRQQYSRIRRKFFATRHYRKEVIKLVDMSLWLIGIIEKTNLLSNSKFRRMDEDQKLDEMLKLNHAKCPYLDLSIVWSMTKCVISIGANHYLLPRPAILLIHNKICDLISVLVMTIYAEGTSMPEDSYDITLSYIKEMCYLMQTYKNKAFEIFKCLEGLGIAETLIQIEEWKNTEFMDVLIDELESSVGFSYYTSNIGRILSNVTVPFRHELMCLSKMVGHPFVDMEKGTEALHKATTEGLEINMSYVAQSINYMKQNYIRNYIQQNGRWPPCQLVSVNAPKALTQAFVLGKDPHSNFILNNFGVVEVDDYVFVEILPNMQYHKLENAIPYLKDKTISVLRSRVLEMYIKNQDPSPAALKTSWAETRCLLAFLIHPSYYHNHTKIMDMMAFTPESISLLDYLVIRVVPKEKELKELYRGFGCKTYEYRLGTLGQEKNVMRFLDEFSDEQAMTMSELELLRRLRAFRSLYKAYPGYKIVYIVIDSSKWNNRFRDLTVDIPMSHFLDKVFDYPIFSKTHELYKRTLVYVPDGTCTYSWDGQAGGIEGQNQDTWVVTYLAQLKVALEGLNIRYHLLCKGDDVRIAVAIPEKTLETTTMRTMKNLIVSRISERMQGFGHVIKIEESYGSCRYFAFSKSASCDHVELPQGYRKIQKCYGASNAFIPTLDEYIAATFSNAHSACKTEPIVIPSYCTAVFWTLYYLMQHPKYHDLTDAEYTALTMIPSLAGGFPVIFLHNMYVRAESDLLSPFLGLYMHCRRQFNEVADVMENFMHVPDIEPEDLDMLFRDPYALPSDRPTLPTTVLRAFIIPALEVLSKNNDVIQLIKASKDENHDLMMELLRTAEPFDVKVLATLYSATPKGVLEELMRKFESSRSINELVILRWGRRRADRRILQVVRAESRLQRWRKNRTRGRNLSKVTAYSHLCHECPSEAADHIRTRSWHKEIIGITMPPMQHQLLLYNAALHGCSNWIKNNHFIFNLEAPTINVSDQGHQHYCACRKEPFVGYTTRTGNIAPSAHFIEKDPVLTKVKNLFDLGSWVSLSQEDEAGNIINSNANQVIDIILGCYTDIPRRILDPFVAHKKSGTIQHHLRAPSFRESIVPNVLSNGLTRFTGESNAHVHLFTSAMHYRLNFLHCYCYAYWIMTQELEFGQFVTTPSVMWGVTTPCRFCNEPIEERPIVFNQKLMSQIMYDPLSILKIGEVAENIIRASVLAWEQKQIRRDIVDKDMTYRAGVIGLLQEMMDVTYYNRRSLEDRYGGYHLGTTSYSIISNVAIKSRARDIGLTELKRIDITVIADYLVQVIAPTYEILAMTRGRHQEHVYLVECPPHELPWYGLVQQIFKAGKLGPLIRLLAFKTKDPPPACHNSPAGASLYVGRACYSLFEENRAEALCVVLSYYNTGQLKNHMIVICRYAIWKSYRTVFLSYIRNAMANSPPDVVAAALHLYRQATCLSFMYDTIEEAVSFGLDRLLERTESKWYLPNLYDLEPEMIEAHHEENKNGRIYRSLMNLCDTNDITWDMIGETGAADVEDFLVTAGRNPDKFSVEVIYSTLEKCISVVRAQGADEIMAARDEEELAYIDNSKTVEVSMVPGNDLPYISYNFRPGPSDPVQYMYHPHIEPLNDMLYTVDPSHVYRVFGSTNGSESYILEVMVDTGLSKRLPDYGNYACIADGLGGASNVIASLTKGQCIILYHTLIEENNTFRFPDALLEGWPQMIDQILVSHLHQGYSHLDTLDTWMEMEKYNRLYTVTICDIELKDQELATWNSIYVLLCLFFLRNRAVDGALVCRINMYNTINLDTCVSILSSYCTYLQVYRPRSMKRFKWAYLVAAGQRKVFTGEYTSFIWHPDPVLCQRVRGFQGLLKINMDSHDRSLLDTMTIKVPDFQYLQQYCKALPSRSYSLCRNLLNLRLNFKEGESYDEFLHTLYSNWGTQHFKSIGLDIVPKINEWIKRLHEDNLPTLYPSQSWTSDTQAHRLHCINSLMALFGFHYGMCLYQGIDSGLLISHNDYLLMFDKIMALLPARDKYHGSHHEMMKLGYESEGIHIVFGCYFIRGIHAFLTLYGDMRLAWTSRHLEKRRIPQENE